MAARSTAPPPALDAVGSMVAHFTGLIERRRTEPADDAISHLVAAGVGADSDTASTVTSVHVSPWSPAANTVTGMLGSDALHRRPGCCWMTQGIPGTDRGLLRLLASAGAGAHNHARRHDR